MEVAGIPKEVDGEQDEEEEEEEDDEPKLRYERIGNALQDILHKDASSCMSVHLKVSSQKLLINIGKMIFVSMYVCVCMCVYACMHACMCACVHPCMCPSCLHAQV